MASVNDTNTSILYSMQYQQRNAASSSSLPLSPNDRVLTFTPPSFDQAFEDSILDRVKDVWQKVSTDDPDSFLVFADREVYDDDE